MSISFAVIGKKREVFVGALVTTTIVSFVLSVLVHMIMLLLHRSITEEQVVVVGDDVRELSEDAVTC